MASTYIRIRFATVDDAPELLAIYTPYVEQTAVTFECSVPTVEEFTARITRTLERYPYLVVEQGGIIVGYAYVGPFKTREAYDWSVETSVYVRRDIRRSGVGRLLYETLERVLAAQGILNLNACVAHTEQPDEYLNRDSVAFHERLGYRIVGEFHQCAHKFGRWYNIVWMEKSIGDHLPDQPAPKSFPDVRAVFEAEWDLHERAHTAAETRPATPADRLLTPTIIEVDPTLTDSDALLNPIEDAALDPDCVRPSRNRA